MAVVGEEVYAFGGFRLDVGERVISRGGAAVPAMPKVFDLLVVLVRSRGRLVTKEELIERVWPDACVDEGSLARTVSRLRALLGPETGEHIETLPKKGYRFTGDVTRVESPAVRDRTLAVLPLRLLGSADAESADLGLGITDALITRLARLRSLRVRPTSAVLRFSAGDADAAAAGRELRVESVLEGRLQLRAGRARVTVQLVRVADGQPVWGEAFEQDAADLYRLQDAIAARLAQVLAVKLSDEEAAALGRPQTTNAAAWQLYLKARVCTYRYVPDAFSKAIDLYALAIETDPEFAAAHSGLAAAYTIGAGTFLPSSEASAKARAAVSEALRLDDTLADAHATLSMIRFWHARDVAGAEEPMRRALALAPHDANARGAHAWQLAARGRLDEAREEAERASDLDPTSRRRVR